MIYLRIRKIEVDVIPTGEPFIAVNIEKIIADDDGNIIQTIGNFDRIHKRLHDIELLPIANMADDNVIDAFELYDMIAQTTYVWVMDKYGGEMINDQLVIG